jgi:uncharacterized membrane protein YfcA
MPADINIWILASTGFAAGLLGSMLGVGGGIFIVPVLTVALGLPIQYAVSSSLISIVINSCTATGVYIREHMTNFKLGLLLSATLIPGAAVGALIASRLSAPTLTILFSLLLIYVAYYMFPKKQRQLTETELEAQTRVDEKSHASHSWLDGSYFDPALNKEVNYQVHRPTVGLVTSFFGGVISSMFGIGGGIINVPVMNRLMKVPVKATVATSGFLLMTTTMTGSLIYIYDGFLVPYVAGPLCVSVFVGSRLGSALAQRAHTRVLVIFFSIFMVLMAILMVLKALHIFGG